jgi:hypothetical protein
MLLQIPFFEESTPSLAFKILTGYRTPRLSGGDKDITAANSSGIVGDNDAH